MPETGFMGCGRCEILKTSGATHLEPLGGGGLTYDPADILSHYETSTG